MVLVHVDSCILSL